MASLALLLAACGSGSDDSAAADEAPPTTEAALGESGLPSLAADDPADDAEADAADEEPAEDVDPETAVEDYEICLAEQGIDVAAVEASSIEDQEAFLLSDEFTAANAVCEPILESAFGDFELDPAFEAELSDRSAELAACGREILGVDIPDDILSLPDDDPRVIELEAIETTPEQDDAIEQCFDDILGDLFDEDGLPVTPEGE